MIRNIWRNLGEFGLKGDLFATAAALLLALALYFFLQALVEGLIAPLIAAVFGEPSIYLLNFTVNGSEVSYGGVLAGLILLVCAAASIFFLGAVLHKARSDTEKAEERGTDAPTP